MEVRPGYKQTDVGVIPEDWVCPSIKEIAAKRPNAIVGGPFGSDLVSKDYVDTGVPVVRGQNMSRQYVSGEFAFVSRAKGKQLQANMAHADDVIFTQRGTLGQVSIVPRGSFEEYLVSQSQMKLTLNSDVANCLYVYHYFASPDGQRQILDSAIQTGVPHTNLGILRSYKIPLPPTKTEQEAIAEAVSDADALIESLEQLLAKKRQLKQGAMQELLTAKKRLPGFSGKWEVQRLAEECGLITKGTTPTSLGRNFTKQGVNFVKVESLTDEGSVIPEMLAAIDDETHRLLRRSQLCESDILFSIAGALGRTAIVIANLLPANTNQALAIIRLKPHSRLHHGFLLKYLTGPQILAHITAINVQAAQANLSLEDIRGFEVPVPSAAEQAAIAAVLSDMEAEIAALEAKLAKACQLKQGMMQELLTGRIRLI